MSEQYTLEDLYEKAKIEVEILCPELRQDLKEDAAQEYVIAATTKVSECKDNDCIRSFQQKCGKNGMLNFLKYENRRKMERYEPSINDADEQQLTPLEILEAREEAGLFKL